jgi:hypothetical protein
VLAWLWVSHEISRHHGRDILPGSRSIPCYARRGFLRNNLTNRVTLSPIGQATSPTMWTTADMDIGVYGAAVMDIGVYGAAVADENVVLGQDSQVSPGKNS